jgi:hypothetical protein
MADLRQEFDNAGRDAMAARGDLLFFGPNSRVQFDGAGGQA